MKQSSEELLEDFFERHGALSGLRESVAQAAELLTEAFRSGHKLLLCGNGGSAADCDHIAGELLKGFLLKRPLPEALQEKLRDAYGAYGDTLARTLQQGLPVISLSAHTALATAFANDADGEFTYAQQVLAYGTPGDVLIGISTSGNAKNVYAAAAAAKAAGLEVIGLTGRDGGRLRSLAGLCLISPEKETYRIQEDHLALYHLLCMVVENELFGE